MNDTALRKPTARRVVGMVAGIVIIALGIALFKQSHLGNDSISALNMRLAELLGISLGTQNLCMNILFFLLEFWFGRKYIGLGTFVNGICIGYIVTAFYDPIHAHFGDAPSLAVPVGGGIGAGGVGGWGSSRRCWPRGWALRSTRPPTSASRPTITFPSVCGTTHPARTSGAASSPMRSAPCCAGCWVALWALAP